MSISNCRLANEPKELTLAYVMTERQTCLPVDCSVKLKLQMTDCEEPYNIAVKHLKMFPNQQTLLDKLECLGKYIYHVRHAFSLIVTHLKMLSYQYQLPVLLEDLSEYYDILYTAISKKCPGKYWI